MYKSRLTFKNINLGLNNLFTNTKQFSNTTLHNDPLEFSKVLIISKLSRYEFEKIKHKDLTNTELENFLRKRGTNFEKLIHFHDLHKSFEDKVVANFKCLGVEIEVVNRFSLKDEQFENADIIVPIGGDGTFLLAASHVTNNRKPVIGFNSDPNRSEGHLCLSKKYSTNIKEALKKLENGQYKWLMRNRIRTTLVACDENSLIPHYIHGMENESLCLPKTKKATYDNTVLPVLALNEVFIGESLSARVSHLQMRMDGSIETTNLKCSGVCVATGTGSTSWHLSINRIPVQSIEELLTLLNVDRKTDLAVELSDKYNKNLIFSPNDNHMGYTIRDLISAGVWPQPKGIKSRGFAKKIEVQSFCYDASLVVDGGVSFAFNDGTIALLEILPEDALRTVVLND